MINSYRLDSLFRGFRRPFPRSPLLVNAFLESKLPLVKLAIGCKTPGKRYFPESPAAGNSSPLFCVGSGF